MLPKNQDIVLANLTCQYLLEFLLVSSAQNAAGYAQAKGELRELSQLNSHLFLDAVPLRLEHIFQDRASIKQGVVVFRVVQKVNTVYPRIGHLLKVFQSLFNILSLESLLIVSSRSVQHIYGLVDLGQYSP